MTWLAVGLVVGLAFGAGLMTWWSSKRIEREGARQYEIGIAEGVRIAEREHNGRSGRWTGNGRDRLRRRRALQKADLAEDTT